MDTKEWLEKHGGAAFPTEQGHTPNGTWNQSYERGMSLRDYFAGQALVGYLAGWPPESTGDADPAATAKSAYKYADAMIAERQQTVKQR